MDCFLCKHCKAITNSPITAPCEESPTGEHEWITGDMVADEVQMDWDRDPDELASSASEK